jgi:hypothetical protein
MRVTTGHECTVGASGCDCGRKRRIEREQMIPLGDWTYNVAYNAYTHLTISKSTYCVEWS